MLPGCSPEQTWGVTLVTFTGHIIVNVVVLAQQRRHSSAPTTFTSSTLHSYRSYVLRTVKLSLSWFLSLSLCSSVCGMGIQFGSFNGICQTAALVICPLIGSDQGIEPSCYSRNVDIAGTLIFQPCELFRVACGLRPSYPHLS